MNKDIFKYVLIVLVVAGVSYLIWGRDENPVKEVNTDVEETPSEEVRPDVANMTYDVDGEVFNLSDGEGTKKSDFVGVTETSLILVGEPLYEDLDGDGDTDAAVWLMNDPGGTGKFYYASFVMNEGDDSVATNAIYLGDRILPGKAEAAASVVTYNFLERPADAPMTAEPTVAKSVKVRFDKKTDKIIEL